MGDDTIATVVVGEPCAEGLGKKQGIRAAEGRANGATPEDPGLSIGGGLEGIVADGVGLSEGETAVPETRNECCAGCVDEFRHKGDAEMQAATVDATKTFRTKGCSANDGVHDAAIAFAKGWWEVGLGGHDASIDRCKKGSSGG